jgi:hypothetical protein
MSVRIALVMLARGLVTLADGGSRLPLSRLAAAASST